MAAGILGIGLVGSINAHAAPNLLPTAITGAGSTVSYIFGAYTVAISQCNETSGGTTISGDCSNEQVIGTVTNNGSLVLTYQTATTGALLNTTVGGANKDMSFTETVSTTGKLINGVVLSLTGSIGSPGNTFEQNDVRTSMVDNAFWGNINTSMSNGASPYTVAQSISPTNSLTISKDMAAGASGSITGDTIALNTVTQTFNVPEPASISLLTIGLGGLLGLRRRRRAQTGA
jgi:hypothetical protein